MKGSGTKKSRIITFLCCLLCILLSVCSILCMKNGILKASMIFDGIRMIVLLFICAYNFILWAKNIVEKENAMLQEDKDFHNNI